MGIFERMGVRSKTGFTKEELFNHYKPRATTLDNFRAVGRLVSHSETIGTTWFPLITGWMSCQVYNDGDSDVYLRIEDNSTLPWEEGEAPIKINESLVLDLKGRSSQSRVLWLICQTGTAAIRVFKLS